MSAGMRAGMSAGMSAWLPGGVHGFRHADDVIEPLANRPRRTPPRGSAGVPDGCRPPRPETQAVVLAVSLLAMGGTGVADEPRLAGVGAAMEELVQAREIAGAVTLVADRDGIVHLESSGLADLASGRPMTPHTLFWIASMTKPVTGAAIAMLIDEGKVSLDDPVETYVPELARLETASGRPARITIRQILTHTSGLGEAPAAATLGARRPWRQLRLGPGHVRAAEAA